MSPTIMVWLEARAEEWDESGRDSRMIISVASGKGGTGKTLVATSLAFSLKEYYRVQLLDCDVEEPNAHIFLDPAFSREEKVYLPVPRVDKEKCTNCGRCAEVCAYNAIAVLPEYVMVFDNLCHGCGACRYLCPEGAITEEENEIGVVRIGGAGNISFVEGRLTVGEAMATPIIRQVKKRANRHWITVIDVPPGTSCPVVESIEGSDFCLLVTEPTPFGLNDLVLAVETVKKLDIPCGVIINRAGGDNSEVEDYCSIENIPVLLTIPLDTEIAVQYSQGITLADRMPQWSLSFQELYDSIRELVDERNRSIKR
ncbi:ATP-binding protein [Chloroflexota bacterium]